ncbi:hypothetical protein [uncultured Clostridium sp.]|nr:hypothetical protein [uncultured Clostridium sp.]
MERLKELINNNISLAAFLVVIYVLGFLHKIIKAILKEKNNRKR